jgi:flagellin
LQRDTRLATAAINNASEAVSMVSLADQALSEISSLLGRMAELADAAINNSLTTSQRTTLQNEFTSIGSQIQTIARETSYDGVNLLSGGANVILQVGYGGSSGSTVTVSGVQATLQAIGLGKATSDQLVYSINDSTSGPAAQNAARTALAAVYTAMEQVDSQRTAIQAAGGRLEGAIQNLSTARENLSAAANTISGLRGVEPEDQSMRSKIVQDAASAFLAQANLETPNVARLLGEPTPSDDSSKVDGNSSISSDLSGGSALRRSPLEIEAIKKTLKNQGES